MGSSGYGFDIKPLPKKQPSSRAVLHEAVRVFLVSQWKAALSRPHLVMARDWILQGDDSLLTVGAPDEDEDGTAERVLFMYYESVEWPEALAHHWVDLALASGKAAFEALLAKHGYKLSGKDYPALGKVSGTFIKAGHKIGHPDEDGVFWQYPEYDFTEYEEMSKAARAKAEAARKGSTPCECPYCSFLARPKTEAT